MNIPFRLLACVVLLASAAAASAQTIINVTFGSTPFTGASAVPGSTSGDVWNVWNAPNGTVDGTWNSDPFVDASGAVTDIEAFARSTTDQIWTGGIPGNPLALFDSYWHLSGLGELSVTIHNLEAERPYDLYIYGARRTDNPDIPTGPGTGTFTVGDTTLWTAYDGTISSYNENVNYVRYVTVMSDAKGMIKFTATDSITNGFSLAYTPAPVPEPATYAALAGLGALGLAILRRRRKAA